MDLAVIASVAAAAFSGFTGLLAAQIWYRLGKMEGHNLAMERNQTQIIKRIERLEGGVFHAAE